MLLKKTSLVIINRNSKRRCPFFLQIVENEKGAFSCCFNEELLLMLITSLTIMMFTGKFKN